MNARSSVSGVLRLLLAAALMAFVFSLPRSLDLAGCVLFSHC